jgi:hypothetical protein
MFWGDEIERNAPNEEDELALTMAGRLPAEKDLPQGGPSAKAARGKGAITTMAWGKAYTALPDEEKLRQGKEFGRRFKIGFLILIALMALYSWWDSRNDWQCPATMSAETCREIKRRAFHESTPSREKERELDRLRNKMFEER